MSAPSSSAPWWRQLTRYHWFVFAVASAAWFFDCLDQRLFSLARIPALASLMGKVGSDPAVQDFGKVVTAWFLIGWGIGGLIFGSLGDKYGRAKMLTLTILIYSGFTGLSFFSRTALDFTICRFLTGLGVGGVFGLAVALIAETVPDGARAQALGLLQVLSTVGNVSAGFAMKGIGMIEKSGPHYWRWLNFPPGMPKWITTLEKTLAFESETGWRWMFLIGAAPAVMVVFTGKYLREPETWLRLKESGRLVHGGILGPYRSLLAAARWRKNLAVGALIASTGVVGLWAIGEYAVDLQSSVFSTFYKASVPAGVPDATKWVKEQVDNAKFWAYLWQMLGAAVGMWIFTRVANAVSRRFAFACGFSAALVVTFLVYWKMNSPQDAYWMMPLMGAAQFSVFAGFAIYLPELFPSRLRSTGTSFCYNLGRFAAAAGSFFSSALSQQVYGHFDKPLPFRYSAMTMCGIFLVGLVTLLFAPETKGQPLPEEEAGAM